MKETRLRTVIIEKLCDTTLFKAGDSYISCDVAEIIKPLLPTNLPAVKNINNSIRQSLETVSGYTSSTGAQHSFHRHVSVTKLDPPIKHNKHLYKNLYTFH